MNTVKLRTSVSLRTQSRCQHRHSVGQFPLLLEIALTTLQPERKEVVHLRVDKRVRITLSTLCKPVATCEDVSCQGMVRNIDFNALKRLRRLTLST